MLVSELFLGALYLHVAQAQPWIASITQLRLAKSSQSVIILTGLKGIQTSILKRVPFISYNPLGSRRQVGKCSDDVCRTEDFHVRINPQEPIPESASEIHSIRYEDVANCQSLPELADQIEGFFAGCDMLVGISLPVPPSPDSKFSAMFP